MAELILQTDHHSLPDNLSVYKYGQTDGSSFKRTIHESSSVKTNYHDNLSGQVIRLFACIYTQTNYQTNYCSLLKFIPDGLSVCSIYSANI